MSEIDEFIKTARAGKPVYLTAEEKQALRNHRAYLKLKAKDPDYCCGVHLEGPYAGTKAEAWDKWCGMVEYLWERDGR